MYRLNAKMQLNLLTFALLVAVCTMNSCSAASMDSRLQNLVNQRQRLVADMNSISHGLEHARLTRNQMNTELLLDQLDRTVWPKIIDSSMAIFDRLTDSDDLDREAKYQEELRRHASTIRFKAKARRCKSPDDTYYPPLKRCVPYQGRRMSNPCPDGQRLYDSPDNIGICDCQKNANTSFIYSDQTKQCHRLYTKGPCKRGQWWIIQNRIPECRTVPKGCPADGWHVHWNKVDPLGGTNLRNATALRKCWRLGTRGPCPVDYLLQLDGETNAIDCKAKSLLTLPSIAVAPRRTYAPLRRAKTWCPRGSQRDRRFKCLV